MWTPVEEKERYNSLDLLRGFALFGVLLINLLYFFRESLFVHMFEPRGIFDLTAARLVEFKAFDLFSLSFGIGVGVQAERAWGRGVIAEVFLVRRFLVLLGIGMVHMVLISNVDILILYAVCGLASIPMLRLPARVLAPVGLLAVFGPDVLSRWSHFPGEAAIRAQGVLATQVYAHNGFVALIGFRWEETVRFVIPILVGVAQKTWGLMLVGVAVWRSGVVREPERYRRVLWGLAAVLAVIGLLTDVHVLLAFGYGSALLAWRPPALAPFASLGRMALTNYLMQSVIFSLVFYGYGLGLFGQMGTGAAAALGVAVYTGQLAFSRWWLGRWRFGPMEWIWRSLTYGKRQKMSFYPTTRS